MTGNIEGTTPAEIEESDLPQQLEYENEIVEEAISGGSLEGDIQVSHTKTKGQLVSGEYVHEKALLKDSQMKQSIQKSTSTSTDTVMDTDIDAEIDSEVDTGGLAAPTEDELNAVPEKFKPFQRKKNRWAREKGSARWISAEVKSRQEEVDYLSAEATRLEEHLVSVIAENKAAFSDLTRVSEQLLAYATTLESLRSWISDRESTYAWLLIREIEKEKSQLHDQEKKLQEWLDRDAEDYYKQAREMKRKFLRKFRISFGGILISLLSGLLVNWVIGTFLPGLGLILNILTILGFANPFTLILKVIGIGSIFSWFFAFLFYFHDYLEWRRKLNTDISQKSFFAELAVKLPLERVRLEDLEKDLRNYISLMESLVHTNWIIGDKWMDFEVFHLEDEKLPTGLDVAEPKLTGVGSEKFNTYVRNQQRSIVESPPSGSGTPSEGWVKIRIDALLKLIAGKKGIPKDSIENLIDNNPQVWEEIESDTQDQELLAKVGDLMVIKHINSVKTQLAKDRDFSVQSIKEDVLAEAKRTNGILAEVEVSDSKDMSWDDFLSSILSQQAGYWRNDVFGKLVRVQDLEDKVESYALIPNRIQGRAIRSMKLIGEAGAESSKGTELSVRVDISDQFRIQDLRNGVESPIGHVDSGTNETVELEFKEDELG